AAMRIDIITIFPEYFGPLSVSLIGKAAGRGDIHFAVHDLRRWATDVHRSVDDAPYGGGPGMVMTPGPSGEAPADMLATPVGAPTPAHGTPTPPPTRTSSPGDPAGPARGAAGPARLVVPSPSGALFTQERAAAYAREPRLIFACGRYEGIDARVAADA